MNESKVESLKPSSTKWYKRSTNIYSHSHSLFIPLTPFLFFFSSPSIKWHFDLMVFCRQRELNKRQRAKEKIGALIHFIERIESRPNKILSLCSDFQWLLCNVYTRERYGHQSQVESVQVSAGLCVSSRYICMTCVRGIHFYLCFFIRILFPVWSRYAFCNSSGFMLSCWFIYVFLFSAIYISFNSCFSCKSYKFLCFFPTFYGL